MSFGTRNGPAVEIVVGCGGCVYLCLEGYEFPQRDEIAWGCNHPERRDEHGDAKLIGVREAATPPWCPFYPLETLTELHTCLSKRTR